MLINAITTRLFCPPDKLLTGLRAKSPTTPYRPSWQRYSSSWWPVVQQIRYWSATNFFLFCFLQDRTRTHPPWTPGPPGPNIHFILVLFAPTSKLIPMFHVLQEDKRAVRSQTKIPLSTECSWKPQLFPMTNARQQVKEKLERFQSLVVPLPIAKQPSLHHFMHSKKMECTHTEMM